VRDLFGNIAVRIKQRAIRFGNADSVERELDRLRIQIAAVTLAWPKPVRIVVSDQQAQQRRKFAIGAVAKAAELGYQETRGLQRMSTFRLDHICTILSHAGYITPTEFSTWTSVSARTSQIFVRAAICLQPAPSKQVQFISLGIHPLDSSSTLSQVLYREVNTLFAESAFGTVEVDDIPEEERLRRLKDRRFKHDGHTNRQLKGKGKATDRWPMFYIRIDPQDEDLAVGVLRSDEDDRQAATFLEKTVQLIRSMTHQFLQERHFRPRARRHRSGLSPYEKQLPANGPCSEALMVSRSLAQSTESSHQVAGDRLQERNLSPADVFPSEGQRKPQKIPAAVLFSSWSRIKSGKLGTFEDLVSGLPRSKPPQRLQRNHSAPVFYKEDTASCANNPLCEAPLTERRLAEDVRLLLRSLNEDSDNQNGDDDGPFEQNAQVALRPRVIEDHERTGTLDQDNSEDGIIVWKNPVSGRSNRINSRTGLSLPELPIRATDDPQTSTSDLSARLPRDIRGSLRSRGVGRCQSNLRMEIQSEPIDWLGKLLTGWENPVFRLKERPIPSVVVEQDEMTHVKAHKRCHGKDGHCTTSEAAGRDGRLSKAALAGANILGQVDKKFILAIMKMSGSGGASKVCLDFDATALVLIDQHAADERCRVEELYAEIGTSNAATTALPKPIIFEITARESELFRQQRIYFESWGIRYKLSANENAAKKNIQGVRPVSARLHSEEVQVDRSHRRPATAIASTTSDKLPGGEASDCSGLQVVVRTLPEGVAERCRLDPKMLRGVGTNRGFLPCFSTPRYGGR